MNITGDARQKALLLHVAGERVHEIYDTLAADQDKYVDAKQKLSTYFEPKKNVQYQVYMFRKAVQQPDENSDTHCTRLLAWQSQTHIRKILRILAKNCEFADVEKEIKAQLIQSCSSTRLRRKALREPGTSLNDLLEYGRAMELSEQQAAGMEGSAVSVNAGRAATSRCAGRARPNNQCRNCGGKYPHDGECPAKGKDCKACGKLNQFAKQCRSNQKQLRKDFDTKRRDYRDNAGCQKTHKKVYNITSTNTDNLHSSSDDEAYVFAASSDDNTKQPRTHIKLNGVRISALIDSGAAVNIISEAFLSTLRPSPQLTPADIKIFPYGSTKPLPINEWSTGKARKTLPTTYPVTPSSCREVRTRAVKVAEEYINFVAQHATPKAMTLVEIKEETLKDPILQQISAHIRNNTWHKVTGDTQHAEILKKFRQISGELTVSLSDDIILRGTRIVIPASLEQRVLQLAHEGHQGIIKTKTLLRSKVWFPNIGQKAESIVKNCLARQANTLVTQSEPLRMSELPEAPWHICADFYNKRTPPYNSEPYTVSEVKGSMVTATKDGQSITRNSSFSKKINAETQDVQTDLDDLVNDTVVVATPRYPSRIYRQLPSHLKYYE
ncbi:hypothetical protein N1851_017146 [Merluccius polli]|uniref:Gypsy retrotransposon integrase-like protein 1 n=1 Tax=Merluccius polli TaxID=89951 RepID=A0AA47P113_MERPO|nr:hypothetical protein N1851_017146 [Merluccius polli]